ncbi:MAG: alpha-E domain-containing protein [Bacteroidetes Order II. Incertae sedis bacterium]|nr:alpha-E domain-containing protein [Bacteroidetes Order II. bacterium]
MLARVADSLYWMSRYLERAEHAARILAVGLNTMLEQSPEQATRQLQRMRRLLMLPTDPDGDPLKMLAWVVLNPENRSSIFSCIATARENARQVREQITSEMWEQVNRMYLDLKQARSGLWMYQPDSLLRAILEGIHLFRGYTIATMNHEQGYNFLELGRATERIESVTYLLEAHFVEDTDQDEQHTGLFGYLEWISLLKTCTAFEAYCKVYTADLQPKQIAEFLLLSGQSPRSVRYNADIVLHTIRQIAEKSGRTAAKLDRLAGRLQATLRYGQIDEVIEEGMSVYLQQIRFQLQQIHHVVYQTYITYPIEKELTV